MRLVGAGALATVAILTATVAISHPAAAASIDEVKDFGTNPGDLQSFEYVPAGLRRRAPLVVALHGANTDHALMSGTSGWRELADRYGFALLLPQQRYANNLFRAFNFNAASDNVRGRGEALSIRQMIGHALARHRLDRKRVFVTGFSAGAHMTSVMLAVDPGSDLDQCGMPDLLSSLDD